MASVADELRVSQRERLAALTADQRLAMTARLAESDLDAFCAARGLARDEGRRLLTARRHVGRQPSRVGQRGEP
jgi:hypothetical protein